MRKVLLMLVGLFCLCGCNNEEELDYKKVMNENEYIIIDVRTKEEYDEGHIKNAINIPYDIIDESINLDKEKILFVYCKSGNRSKEAYNTLNTLGYTVYDLGAYSKIDLEKEKTE